MHRRIYSALNLNCNCRGSSQAHNLPGPESRPTFRIGWELGGRPDSWWEARPAESHREGSIPPSSPCQQAFPHPSKWRHPLRSSLAWSWPQSSCDHREGSEELEQPLRSRSPLKNWWQPWISLLKKKTHIPSQVWSWVISGALTDSEVTGTLNATACLVHPFHSQMGTQRVGRDWGADQGREASAKSAWHYKCDLKRFNSSEGILCGLYKWSVQKGCSPCAFLLKKHVTYNLNSQA